MSPADIEGEEREILACHVYKNKRVLCTVLVAQTSPRTWMIYRGDQVLGVAASETEALELAEFYLEGYRDRDNEGNPP